MDTYTNSIRVLHHNDNKAVSAKHTGKSRLQFVDKMQPKQKHPEMNGAVIKPNGDPDEVMLWGDA